MKVLNSIEEIKSKNLFEKLISQYPLVNDMKDDVFSRVFSGGFGFFACNDEDVALFLDVGKLYSKINIENHKVLEKFLGKKQTLLIEDYLFKEIRVILMRFQ